MMGSLYPAMTGGLSPDMVACIEEDHPTTD
jgi:hypothetical protein